MGVEKYFRKTVSVFFEYDTPKIIHIRSKKIGVTNRLLQLIIISYIVGFAIVYKKGYQESCPVDSVVTTKVKGTVYTNLSSSELGVSPNFTQLYQRIWDPTDYVIPSSGGEQGGFFIITNVIITPNQTRGICPEDYRITEALCNSSQDCFAGKSLEVGNGVMTGNCVNSTKKPDKLNSTQIQVCEIYAWCPVEVDQPPLKERRALLDGSRNFTVLIKNVIQFPKFGKQYTRRNVLENTNKTYLQDCIYDPVTDPFCPVFRIGDIVEDAGENYTQLAIKGAVFEVRVSWYCNLDFDFMKYCRPKYSFQRMDSPEALISPGWNFRTGEYHEENRRTLFKNFGIKFLIRVEGQAGKFNAVPLFINVGSGLALMGLATFFCDVLVLKCLKNRRFYNEKKYKIIRAPDAFDVESGDGDERGEYSQFDNPSQDHSSVNE